MTISSDFIYDLTTNANTEFYNYDIVSEYFPKDLNNDLYDSQMKSTTTDTQDTNNCSNTEKSNTKFTITIIRKKTEKQIKQHLFIIEKVINENIELTTEENQNNNKDIYIFVDLTKKTK